MSEKYDSRKSGTPKGNANPRLLILGGGTCQMHAFARAAERGNETVLFDYLPDPPAAALAGSHRRISTFDRLACLEEAARLNLDGAMTVGTDQPVFTCAWIAAKLGLPRLLSPATALAVTNKALMKRVLTKNAIPTARWFLAGKHDLATLPLAGEVVIKPVDSQGQKGVIRAESVARAAAFFDESIAFSRRGKLLCEAFYPSEEVTVSAWVAGGHTHMLGVTDRVTFRDERHIGVCAAHRYPSLAASGHEAAIADLTRRTATAFGIADGPLYIQFLIGEEGVILNELSSRIGGAFEDVFIPWLTGFDILGAVMDTALGGPVAVPEPFTPGAKQVRVLMPFARPGRLAAMTPPDAVRRMEGVLDARFNFQPGDTLPPFENAGARLGVIVLAAENETRMRQCLDAFYAAFTARDAAGDDMLLDAWRIR